ncbi:FG-GAP repeat domain-containing protein [Streptomyces sp. NPDC048111]|uniref:FG-GAP repeat domain-containing protein n=1 Tax=Streptomyces sp. NPDC048111 TaxID=3365500 RepID=UPI0037106DF8
MRNTRLTHARRIAACTAIAIAAGTLLSTPALAEDKGPGAPKAAAAKIKPRFDWDGDGKGDIVYRNAAGVITTLSGGGAVDTAPLVLDNPHADIKSLLTPGDLTGDGKPDVLWTDSVGNLYALTGGGPQAGAQAYKRLSSGWNMYDAVVAAGDLTGDGKNDVLARTATGDVYLFPGTGNVDSPFGERTKVATAWDDYDQIVGVADADGDGIGDVYVRTRADDLLFIGGTGDAAKPFKAPVELGAGWHSYNQLLTADDTDGDGISDLLARTRDGRLYTYKGLGNGRFGTPAVTASGWQAAFVLGNAGGHQAVGKNVLVTADPAGRNETRTVTNDGQFTNSVPWESPQSGRTTVAVANSLSDSGEATRLQTQNGELWVDHFGRPATSLGKGWDAYTSLVGPGDVNGDGHNDLLARDKAGVLWQYLGDGSGTKFSAPQRLGAGWNAYNKLVGSGDINGDGKADLLARDTNGHLWLYPGTSDIATPFGVRKDLGAGWNSFTKLAAVADATGNGTTDLIAVDGSGAGKLYDGQGAYGGKFKPAYSLGGGWDAYTELF